MGRACFVYNKLYMIHKSLKSFQKVLHFELNMTNTQTKKQSRKIVLVKVIDKRQLAHYPTNERFM